MNYAALVSAIQDTVENYDPTFVANIPIFVQAAEKKIYNEVELPAVSVSASGALTPSVATFTVPSDFLSMFEIAVVTSSEWRYLLNKEVGYMREAYPLPTYTNTPKYYALLDPTTLLLAPTPANADTVQYRYYAYPESIVTASTTWLGDNFQQLLLYASLVEAYIFMKGEQDVLDMYGKSYAYELGLLKQLNGSKVPLDAFRGGQYSRGK